ncbi:MAG: helix-turn-helix domain-containing protein [Ruminiclostridium sp.]|nr:helix-turn-helix domain-containing protein [Ruminiclostridium sp.]
MRDIGAYIKQLRTERGMTQSELGKIIGVQKAAVQKWENGTVRNLKRKTVLKLSEYFGVAPATFVDDQESEILKISDIYTDGFYRIPVFESVSAGFGSYADSEITDYVPLLVRNPSEAPLLMGLKVQGDSMYPKIEDGDIIVVRRQTSVDSGSIAVVLMDGEEGFVKKVEYGRDWIELISVNPEYKPRRFEGEDVERIRVVGLVKQIIKDL